MTDSGFRGTGKSKRVILSTNPLAKERRRRRNFGMFGSGDFSATVEAVRAMRASESGSTLKPEEPVTEQRVMTLPEFEREFRAAGRDREKLAALWEDAQMTEDYGERTRKTV